MRGLQYRPNHGALDPDTGHNRKHRDAGKVIPPRRFQPVDGQSETKEQQEHHRPKPRPAEEQEARDRAAYPGEASQRYRGDQSSRILRPKHGIATHYAGPHE